LLNADDQTANSFQEEVKGFVVESMIDKSVLNFKENLAVSASNLSILSGRNSGGIFLNALFRRTKMTNSLLTFK